MVTDFHVQKQIRYDLFTGFRVTTTKFQLYSTKPDRELKLFKRNKGLCYPIPSFRCIEEQV